MTDEDIVLLTQSSRTVGGKPVRTANLTVYHLAGLDNDQAEGRPLSEEREFRCVEDQQLPAKIIRLPRLEEARGSSADDSTRAAGSLQGLELSQALAPTSQWAAHNRDAPGALDGRTHQCSKCLRNFQQSQLLIAQEDPNYDVGGSLYKLCFDCCQCRGPAFSASASEVAAVLEEERALGELAAAGVDHHLIDDGKLTPATLAGRLSTLRRQRRRVQPDRRPAFQLSTEEENVKAFKTKARASWRARADSARNIMSQRVRNMNHDEYMKALLEEFPGESRAEIRRKFRAIGSQLATRVNEAITAMSANAQKVVGEAMVTWESQLARKAEDLGDNDGIYIPEITTNIFLDSHAFQWVDTIVAGLNEFWICRHKPCLMVIPSVCWLKNGQGGWQFRCPACCRLYQPWVKSTGRIAAQKCLCISDTPYHPPLMLSDSALSRVAVEPLVVRSACLRLDGSLLDCVLTEWPDTSTENLINTLKAAALGIVDEVRQEVREVPLEESEAKLARLMRVQKVPVQFSIREFTDQQWILDKNKGAKQGTVDADWSFEHLRDEKGAYSYVGMKYPYVEGEEIMTYQQCIQAYALAKYVCSAKVSIAQSRL